MESSSGRVLGINVFLAQLNLNQLKPKAVKEVTLGIFKHVCHDDRIN